MSLAMRKAHADEEWQVPDMQQSEALQYRLLIATDDSQTTDSLRQIFPDDRFKLAFASNGLDALQKVRTFEPHCILTKPYLSGMNGLMLARMVKYDKRYKTIPVIMILSGITEPLKDELRKVGVDDVLVQPYDNRTVMKTVVNQVYSLLISNPKPIEPELVEEVNTVSDIVW